jgi:hypothetical protein
MSTVARNQPGGLQLVDDYGIRRLNLRRDRVNGRLSNVARAASKEECPRAYDGLT